MKLSVENEQLRSGGGSLAANGSANINSTKIQALEKRILTQQEELTDLHKRKGENSQMIVDLNIKLEKQNKLLADNESRYVSDLCILNIFLTPTTAIFLLD